MPLDSDQQLRELLRSVASIAVLGAKADPAADAGEVPLYLQRAGYSVHAVNPRLASGGWEGAPAYARLADLPGPVDLVDVFRAPEHLPGHVEEILALPWRPRAVWLQLGIRHEATARLEEVGIDVVENRCLMVEHDRLLRGAA